MIQTRMKCDQRQDPDTLSATRECSIESSLTEYGKPQAATRTYRCAPRHGIQPVHSVFDLSLFLFCQSERQLISSDEKGIWRFVGCQPRFLLPSKRLRRSQAQRHL